jgi:hypothetical protein
MQFVKALPVDGRWRIVVFTGNIHKPTSTETLDKVDDQKSPVLVAQLERTIACQLPLL